MSDVTQLGHIRINGADKLTISQLRPEDLPAMGPLSQPSGSVVSCGHRDHEIIDPKQFPISQRGLCGCWLLPPAELTQIKARKRPLSRHAKPSSPISFV